MENDTRADNALAPAFGKFQTGEALLKAYNNLESEFTKRSQRLKELEGECDALKNGLQEQRETVSKQLDDDDFIAAKALASEKISQKIIDGYLQSSFGLGAPVLTSATGKSALTPVNKPKTLADAKKLADIIIRS